MSGRVNIVDCTLREGDQTAGVSMRPEEKLAIALMLDEAGIALADAGMPAVGVGEQKFLRAAADQCRRMVIGASVRCRADMVQLALDCGVGAVFIICPVSDGHLRERLGLSIGQLIDALAACVAVAGDHASIEVVAEDATRASDANLHALASASSDLGAERFYIADTVGSHSPEHWRTMVRSTRAALGAQTALGVHCHNDFGMATALTVAAVELGVRWPTVTVNGLGERAGNADLGSVAAACEHLLGADTGVDLTALPHLSRAVERAACIPVPAAHPVVGANAFRHESGIHVHGVLADPSTYEAIAPEAVGRRRTLLLGKHSGTHHIERIVADAGIGLTDPEIRQLRMRVQDETMRKREARFDAVLEAASHYRRSAQGVSVGEVLLWAAELVAERE